MTKHPMTWSLIVIAGLVLTHPPIGTSQTPSQDAEARRLFTEGANFSYGGNYVEAEKKFREALRKYPRADQADKTAYFLIDTLVKLRRVQDARTEIENFRRNYPKSIWQDDVSVSIFRLGGVPDPPAESGIWNSPAELREAQRRADQLRGAITPDGPPDKIYSDEFPPNPSMKAEQLRRLIQLNPDDGIEEAKRLLRIAPSDPAVVANLGTIANSNSPKAVPFLLSLWVNTSTTPNMRNSAFFWFTRRNPNKEEVAKAIMDFLTKNETEGVASQALYRMTVADHRAVLEKIVNSSNPEKFVLMEKIYRNGSVLLRTDLLMFVALLDDRRAVPFIVQAAQNDRDPSVRAAAAKALGNRKDVDAATLQTLIRSTPPPRPAQPPRFAPANGPAIPAIPVAPGSGPAIPGSGSAFPILVP